MKTKPKTHDIAALAKKHHCCQKTVRRWLQQGAPVEDPARLRLWLAARKHRPKGVDIDAELSVPPVPSVPPPPEVSEPLSIGAAAALHRLERAEGAAALAFAAAEKAGDPVATKLAADLWLKFIYQLRLLDAAIEQGRRDAGELIDRGRVVEQLNLLGVSIRLGIYRAATEAPGGNTPAGRRSLIDSWMSSILSGLALAAAGFRDPIPPWVINSLSAGMEGEYRAAQVVFRRAVEMATALGVELDPGIVQPPEPWPDDINLHKTGWAALKARLTYAEFKARYGHLGPDDDVPAELQAAPDPEPSAAQQAILDEWKRNRKSAGPPK